MVYSAGALSPAFKLWYDGAPIEPVLVQLPRSLPVSQATTEVLPAAIAAGLLAILIWKRMYRSWIGRAISEPAKRGIKDPAAEVRSVALGPSR